MMSDNGASVPDRAVAASPSSPAVSPVSASIPSAYVLAEIIAAALEAHPSWLPEAMDGLTRGMNRGIGRLNDLRAKSDAACLAALALCDTKRIPPDLKATLLGKITDAMHPPSLCELERKFSAQAIEARRAETLGSVHESAMASPCAQGDAA